MHRRKTAPRERPPRFALASLVNPINAGGFLCVILIMYAYTWLYLGSLWNPLTQLSKVTVGVLNADRGFQLDAMPAATQAMLNQATGGRPMGEQIVGQLVGQDQVPLDWRMLDASTETRDTLLSHVDEGDYQFALYIPPSFSMDYVTAFQAPNGTEAAPYHQMQVEFIHDQGRNYGSDSMVGGAITRLLSGINRGMTTRMLSGPAAQQTRNAMVPAFWIEPLGTVNTVLHPVNRYGQNFAAYISPLVLYISCIGIVTIMHRFMLGDPIAFGHTNGKQSQSGAVDVARIEEPRPNFDAARVNIDADSDDEDDNADVSVGDDDQEIREASQRSRSATADSADDTTNASASSNVENGRGNDNEQPHAVFSIARLLLAKQIVLGVVLFLCALMIWSVPMCLEGYQFDGAPAAAALFFLFFSGCAFIGVINLLCCLFGLDGFSLPAALLLIIFLTTGSAILSEDLAPGFYLLGKGLPFYYAVRGLRYIYFGSQSSGMWLNCVVLAAWAVVSIVASLIAGVYKERRRRGIVFSRLAHIRQRRRERHERLRQKRQSLKKHLHAVEL
ncbi:hypothetical protein THASP1DRAFT_28672 [Thamnocephalis sphaerospora]|uniref:DUF3533 domain-containing protein n=1 Tax=Thamnocephalis sphaerospora TaxID=78915 RepID=A0A4P9XVB4_9FUNG|nr:hypothetical protein THASP1DRAFT_28672 [Thamnocephalis sphaerospora]|eukprot:RKP09541.1 hypothetical protein THASP1DRAFT_28672 [Thamnocephalis sphaerospora]